MSEEAVDNALDSPEGVATILGLILVHQGKVRIPGSLFEEGLPPNSGIRVEYDARTDELIIDIASMA